MSGRTNGQEDRLVPIVPAAAGAGQHCRSNLEDPADMAIQRRRPPTNKGRPQASSGASQPMPAIVGKGKFSRRPPRRMWWQTLQPIPGPEHMPEQKGRPATCEGRGGIPKRGAKGRLQPLITSDHVRWAKRVKESQRAWLEERQRHTYRGLPGCSIFLQTRPEWQDGSCEINDCLHADKAWISNLRSPAMLWEQVAAREEEQTSQRRRAMQSVNSLTQRQKEWRLRQAERWEGTSEEGYSGEGSGEWQDEGSEYESGENAHSNSDSGSGPGAFQSGSGSHEAAGSGSPAKSRKSERPLTIVTRPTSRSPSQSACSDSGKSSSGLGDEDGPSGSKLKTPKVRVKGGKSPKSATQSPSTSLRRSSLSASATVSEGRLGEDKSPGKRTSISSPGDGFANTMSRRSSRRSSASGFTSRFAASPGPSDMDGLESRRTSLLIPEDEERHSVEAWEKWRAEFPEDMLDAMASWYEGMSMADRAEQMLPLTELEHFAEWTMKIPGRSMRDAYKKVMSQTFSPSPSPSHEDPIFRSQSLLDFLELCQSAQEIAERHSPSELWSSKQLQELRSWCLANQNGPGMVPPEKLENIFLHLGLDEKFVESQRDHVAGVAHSIMQHRRARPGAAGNAYYEVEVIEIVTRCTRDWDRQQLKLLLEHERLARVEAEFSLAEMEELRELCRPFLELKIAPTDDGTVRLTTFLGQCGVRELSSADVQELEHIVAKTRLAANSLCEEAPQLTEVHFPHFVLWMNDVFAKNIGGLSRSSIQADAEDGLEDSDDEGKPPGHDPHAYLHLRGFPRAFLRERARQDKLKEQRRMMKTASSKASGIRRASTQRHLSTQNSWNASPRPSFSGSPSVSPGGTRRLSAPNAGANGRRRSSLGRSATFAVNRSPSMRDEDSPRRIAKESLRTTFHGE